ncbi:metal ABC transporter permease [Immundisolibacter cernigliae]|uniref:Zinc/manganese transporter permease n=1 Tax=Immundisolibacter cernigliae TaxID=1810504 RepID=A0A1B1YX44_9GAMM|nr:metal ABC transporter permease [Immundisolibacter cernigliae]ANX05308.1 zinc/manganese transporter permease [Immundisolibacter cernigliae]
MTLDGLEPTILLPAMAAGLLVLVSHVPLGMEVLRRGIIFIDLAIAQIAGLGIVIASTLGFEVNGWRTQLSAVIAALAGALCLRWMEKKNPDHLEAVIGVSFVAAACAAIVLMSHDPHAGEHLQELLVGQILWTTWAGLLPLALVTAGVLAGWFGCNLKASPLGFYLLFALTITASVQVVGVYLVFASLIVPALAAAGRLWRAYAVGVAGYGLGLLVSGLFDLPAGAAIVLMLVVVAVLAGGLARASNRTPS